MIRLPQSGANWGAIRAQQTLRGDAVKASPIERSVLSGRFLLQEQEESYRLNRLRSAGPFISPQNA